ncbi:pilus assembly protein TadG-related protein [Streptomyces sp. NPDC088261]|uniref:pilus assembly protein TadG-related protein n=1 Tax=Streptomyces sp. NPDC088261 TaxID=3365851 RepID=UPI00382C13E1
MISRSSREAGQAAPLYIMMVASLLFLALAFFAVGQAGATRNGAQSGADAAALAAAQESRDLFKDDLVKDLLTPGFLDDVFNGNPIGSAEGCAAAGYFAGQNGSDVSGCAALTDGRWGFTVDVVTQEPVGNTILPGTENKHGEARATAVVEPRCSFEAAGEQENPPGEPGEPGESGEPGEPGEAGEDDPADDPPASPGDLHCEGAILHVDPEPDLLPDMADLFTVRLAQD